MDAELSVAVVKPVGFQVKAFAPAALRECFALSCLSRGRRADVSGAGAFLAFLRPLQQAENDAKEKSHGETDDA